MKKILFVLVLLFISSMALARTPTLTIDTMRVNAYGNVLNYFASCNIACTRGVTDSITLPLDAKYVELECIGSNNDTVKISYAQNSYGTNFSDFHVHGTGTAPMVHSRIFEYGIRKIYVLGVSTLTLLVKAWN